jgi:hypothetical protein
MVTFVEIDPKDIDTSRSGRRGRVSYPIIKGFMELNRKVVKLDLTGLNKNPQYLYSVLSSYIRNHNMPIKVFSAGGDLHLMRLDLNNDGTPNPDWKPEMQTTEGAAGHEFNMAPAPLNSEEVARRFAVERGQSLK